MLGSVIPAASGELTVLVSGEEAAFAAARPLLETIGSRLFFLGAPGQATKMKLAGNLVLATTLAGLADATAIAEASGIAREQALEILGAGPGNGAVLASKRDKVLREDYSPHFSAALLYKDLHYLQDLARTLRRPLFTAGLVKELFALSFAHGLEERDVSVIFPILRGKAALPSRERHVISCWDTGRAGAPLTRTGFVRFARVRCARLCTWAGRFLMPTGPGRRLLQGRDSRIAGELVSVRIELQIALWAGVTLIAGGAGMLVKENLAHLGPLTIGARHRARRGCSASGTSRARPRPSRGAPSPRRRSPSTTCCCSGCC